MSVNFFEYKIDKWKVSLCYFLERKVILDKYTLQTLIESLDNISNAFSTPEKVVLKSIKEELELNSFSSLKSSFFDSCLSDCEKDKGLYCPVMQLTVMISCIYFYKVKKGSAENEREKQIYEFSKKQILQRMYILSSNEKQREFYAKQENKIKLLSPIIFSKMKVWEVYVADEFVFGVKFYFEDIDGKKHWANSSEKRETQMREYSISYVKQLKDTEYYKDSSMDEALFRINDDCKKLVDDLSICI